MDAVVSNPPYSQAWNSADKESDPRYARFGLAPKGKADYAFLLHDLFHLKSNGIMTIVLPHGVLFRGGEEGTIRKNLIEQNHIDAIIGLPANIFFGTGIPTIIMVLKQKRPNTDVLIIDASKGFAKVGKNNVLRACDIKKIVDVVTSRTTVEKFSKVVPRDEIRANDYNLNIPRYVDSSEKAESWDLYASMFGGIPEQELADLHADWEAFPTLKDTLFRKENEAYCCQKVADLKEAVWQHSDIKRFLEAYAAAFTSFEGYLTTELIDGMTTLNPSKEEAVLSEDVFARLANIPLVDRYEAYQLLDEDWNRIAIDLEVIQTEGFAAVKQVDPNMVLKKKDGKDQEVHEGWVGHVIPFALVQETLLSDDLSALNGKENRLTELASAYEELLDELPEEEKSKDFVNEAQDAFVPAELKKVLKAKDAEPEVLAILKKADALLTEEKAVKREVKEDAAKLHSKTKETIEALSDDAATELIKQKWISPLVENMEKLPQTVIGDLIVKLEALSRKYESTFADVEQQISETEKSLIDFLDQLTGNEFDMKGLAEFKTLLGGE
ncbi:MAG: N-6 DNA methylase [Pseudoflavonifractor sp.]|nr:N-6 DNA methylase [Pseudoflavonifractor sp.]